jgi:hypothetical protein
MAVEIAHAKFVSAVTTGTQDLEITGFGQPQVAIVRIVGAEDDDTYPKTTIDCMYNLGFTDDASTPNCVATGGSSEDGVASSNTWSRSSSGRICDYFTLTSGSLVTQQANMSAKASWPTDGIQIDWTAKDTQAVAMLVTFIKGLDDYKVGVHDFTFSAENDTEDVALGFAADVVIVGGQTLNAFPKNLGNVYFGQGMAAWNGASFDQFSHTRYSRTARTNGEVWSIMRNDAVYTNMTITGTETSSYEITGRDSMNLEFTARNSGSDLDHALFYLAMSQADWEHKVIVDANPTSTGNDAKTGVGFVPDHVFSIQTNLETLNSRDGTDESNGKAWGVFDGTNEWTVGCSDEDGSATMNTDSWIDDSALYCDDAGLGTRDYVATFVSFDADGFTLNYTTVPTTANYVGYLAINTGSGGGGGGSAGQMDYYRRRRTP